MSEKTMQQLILIGLAGAAVYFIFFRSSAVAFPGSVTITPENPGLLPPPAQAQPIALTPGWLSRGF